MPVLWGRLILLLPLLLANPLQTVELRATAIAPAYGNPFAHGGKCGGGQSKIKLKISGNSHKVCAPKCDQNQGKGMSCPSSQVKAIGTCISVSKRELCVLTCVGTRECPAGAICHKTPSISLCIFEAVARNSEAASINSVDPFQSTHTLSHTRNQHPKVALPRPRSHCVDSCPFASDGRCDASKCGLGRAEKRKSCFVFLHSFLKG